MKLLISISLLLLWLPFQSNAMDSLQYKIKDAESRLRIKILYEPNVVDIWNGVTYDEVIDSAKLSHYIDIMLKEYSKYPQGYIGKCFIKSIVLTSNLKFQGQSRAAVPDPYKGNLYLSVNGAYNVESFNYLVHVMHHELHHCAEYALWKNMMYDWREWMLLNDASFTYGQGGTEAYKNLHIDYYSPTNPKNGFINLYSTTGDEEDRAELIAFLMTDPERPALQKYMKTDAILKKKTDRIMLLIHDFTEGMIRFPALGEP